MQLSGVFLAAALAIAGMAAPGHAAPRVSEKTTYYAITGKTGMELLWDMSRRGPKHGFLSKATALTTVNTTFKGDFIYQNGTCRTRNAAFVVSIVYTYPKPKTQLTGDLGRRWRSFYAELQRHEQVHGRLARQMAADVDRKLQVSARDTIGCKKTIARVKREIDAIRRQHDKVQKAFDVKEHRDNGPVEKSVLRLIGKR